MRQCWKTCTRSRNSEQSALLADGCEVTGVFEVADDRVVNHRRLAVDTAVHDPVADCCESSVTTGEFGDRLDVKAVPLV